MAEYGDVRVEPGPWAGASPEPGRRQGRPGRGAAQPLLSFNGDDHRAGSKHETGESPSGDAAGGQRGLAGSRRRH
jgi:hypothetical protein